ncbi:MAG TPA: type II CAAX endopeptidase family protein [Candidatus Acidoferrum sp.]|nr:type II CAAX endopeptidase family protein [Candidatus Acidoferrum sp.]
MVLLGVLNTYRGIWQAVQSRAGTGPGRLELYGRILFFELLFLGIVIVGVRLRGVSLQTIFGKRWQSAGEVFRDLGLGVCLLVLSTIVGSVLAGHGGRAADQAILYMIPQTSLELALWMVISLAAGICEEAIFRGYLQRQFSALAKNVPVGIVLAAGAFGASHLYQGFRRAAVIAIAAVVFGWFAHWRKTVRPGMVAHTLQDAVAPLLLRAMRR